MHSMLARILISASLLALHGQIRADDELEGTAFVGAELLVEARAMDEARVDAAERYVACLQSRQSSWLATPDYTACDAIRAEYSTYLAAAVADSAIGCLEEGAIGAPRVSGRTCAALRTSFPVAQPTSPPQVVAP